MPNTPITMTKLRTIIRLYEGSLEAGLIEALKLINP